MFARSRNRRLVARRGTGVRNRWGSKQKKNRKGLKPMWKNRRECDRKTSLLSHRGGGSYNGRTKDHKIEACSREEKEGLSPPVESGIKEAKTFWGKGGS